ncbi:Spermidine coumaroyl-CoA acyltransferase [Cardamine amara subsp. amara]|uniref:Spermidine coumaroyl-CoA acyltransferase n=1 Tax=Cardamine amara subsp. amara TaxID=228776 RepID=A0ABD1B680_CARAN
MTYKTKLSLPLVLEKKPVEFVRPSKHTPCEILSLSTLDNDFLNEVMYATIYVFKANEKNRNDPVSLLRKAFSDLLVYYYPLSGKLTRRESDRKLQLVCRGEGVQFEVATTSLDLSSLNYIENLDDQVALQLVPEIEIAYNTNVSYQPLALQVTKFSCGGFTIGTALMHAVCDGFGVAQIIHALTELAGGKSEPSVIPVWQRERLVGKVDNEPAKVPGGNVASLLVTSPYIPSNDMVTETINIQPGTIKKLKDYLMRECNFPKECFTTYEVISSCIWKLRSRALKLNPDGITVLGVAVGIRHILDAPLPQGYYGNAYIDVYVELTVRELEEASISDIAKNVKKAKKTAYDKGYLKEELNNTERLMRENVKFEGVSDGLLVLTDWRNIGWFGSMDFGWNEPVNLRPLSQKESAAHMGMILRPSKLDASMEGGVKVIMTLPRDAMVEFKKEMDAMNKLYYGDNN